MHQQSVFIPKVKRQYHFSMKGKQAGNSMKSNKRPTNLS